MQRKSFIRCGCAQKLAFKRCRCICRCSSYQSQLNWMGLCHGSSLVFKPEEWNGTNSKTLHSYLTSVNISKCVVEIISLFLCFFGPKMRKYAEISEVTFSLKKRSKTQMSSFPEKGRIEFQNTLQVKYCEVKIFQNYTRISLWSENEPNNMLEHQEVHIKS